MDSAEKECFTRPSQSCDTGSSGSDSESTEEEERLRRLFNACDRDDDGYIDKYEKFFYFTILP